MKKRAVLLVQLMVALAATFSGELAVAAEGDLPATQRAGQVTWLSGGIGLDQSHALKDVMRDYPLVLTFVDTTRGGNEYLSDVLVTITDVGGKTVLDTTSDGPFMLISLPGGRYTIAASYGGKTEQHTVNVSTARHARQTFTWVM